jgi:hypothetical protein
MKTISQNPDRYSKQGDSWVISANGDSPNKGVKPLTLTTTPLPFTLKPYLKSNGIIVKAGEHYLISEVTLKEITNSANPHYDTKQNGVVMVKKKGVKIGVTIPIIEVKIDGLQKLGSERDIRNRNAGIASVDYIYETEKIDGVPKGIIDQINYTLVQDMERPMDTFSVMELALGDDTTVYNVEPLNVATTQEEGKLDKLKMEIFLKDINARLKILNNDFNMIKGVFLEGKEPTMLGKVDITKKAETNPPEDTTQIVYKYSTLSGIQTSASQQIADAAAAAKKAADEAAAKAAALAKEVARPDRVRKLQMRKRTDFDANTIPVYKLDPSLGNAGKIIVLIREGDIFYGYFLKDYKGGKIWVVYEANKTTLIGYGNADSNDFVDEI